MSLLDAVSAWFAEGGPVMPSLLGVGLVLYALLLERGLGIAAGESYDPDRDFGVVRALIAAAPLLGLLGTVSGLIESFDALLEDSRIRQIGVGIGHALRTTQYGIALAAPALLLERILTRQAEARR